MSPPSSTFDRIIVGGGIFGAYSALVLADRGLEVCILEQSDQLMTRASFVNQARLHTGLHYPRSIVTARESFVRYQQFRERFPTSIRDFTQFYAVSAHNSKTTGVEFERFISRLDQEVTEVDPERWFRAGTVSKAFRVSEPSFDAQELRRLIAEEIAARKNIQIRYGAALTGGVINHNSSVVTVSDGSILHAGGLVIAAYASTNAVRLALGLEPLPLTFELAEVILGHVDDKLANLGFTVMDGPFWSLMPFGHTNQVTLTSVGLTPLRKSTGEPEFPCQAKRSNCTPLRLANCTTCSVRPPSASIHQIQQMDKFLKYSDSFKLTGSMLTVKAILTNTEVDDARPTLIRNEMQGSVYTIFSGKISTLFDLDKELH